MMKFSSGEKTGNRLLFYFCQCYFEILSTYGLLTPILKQFSNVTFIKKNRSVFSDGAHSAACWASDLVRVK